MLINNRLAWPEMIPSAIIREHVSNGPPPGLLVLGYVNSLISSAEKKPETVKCVTRI